MAHFTHARIHTHSDPDPGPDSASSGLGKYLAGLLLGQGYSLILVGRNEAGLRGARSSLLRAHSMEAEAENSQAEAEGTT